jgi:nifR3 family TIM-barrel protein
MARAAAAVERLERFDCIDVNCGCPVRKIVARGCGVALMEEPERIGRIVAAIRAAVSLPVTVKTRRGLAPGRDTVSEVAKAAEEAGAAAVFVHARFATQKHSGPVDWETLARVKSERGIPVIGNGEVRSAATALAMLRATGVDGVMIGRGAVGCPWLFREVRAALEGRACPPRTTAELRAAVAEQLGELVRLKSLERRLRRGACLPADVAAALHFRSHLHQYLAGMPGWGPIRRRLQEIRTPEDVMAAVDTVIAATEREEASRNAA